MLREPVLRTASEGAPVEREKKVRFKLTVRIRETPQASDVTGLLALFSRLRCPPHDWRSLADRATVDTRASARSAGGGGADDEQTPNAV